MKEALKGLAAFGQWSRPNAGTVRLGHPDAAAALANTKLEAATQFFAPPFDKPVLKIVQCARVVPCASGVIGEPLPQSMLPWTTAFARPLPGSSSCSTRQPRRAGT